MTEVVAQLMGGSTLFPSKFMCCLFRNKAVISPVIFFALFGNSLIPITQLSLATFILQ